MDIKYYPQTNLLYEMVDNEHFFAFPLKDGKEFVILQSKWREIFCNYKKIEVAKPRSATIGHRGAYSIKPTLIINFNDWLSTINSNHLQDFHTLYQRTFQEKKNVL